MKTFLQYIRLELKRMLLSFPGICISSLLMLTLITGFLFVCHLGNNNSKHKQRTTIGVVAEKDEPFVDWMITTVSGMQRTQDAFRFKKLSEKQANEQLREGKISIIFIIPRQYVSSIINGTNKHVTIRFSKGQTTIVSFLLRQLSEAVSSFILNSEAGIYSMQEYYKRYQLPNRKNDELTLNIQYIKEITTLKRGVQVEELQTNVTYPLTAMYTISAIILFAFLWGLTCSKMLTSQSGTLQNQLWRNGLRLRTQLLARAIAFFLTNVINFTVITALVGILFMCSKINLPDTLLTNLGGLWSFFILLLPVLLLTSAFIQLAYEITEDSFGGILFLFFSVMIMGLFSGCFYPFDHLPEMIQTIGKYLPVYLLCRYSLAILYKSFDTMAFLSIWLYSFSFYGTILLIRHIRRIQNTNK